ncbi:MAG: DUF512 domain-containing protein, partial [Geobacteraceae bacterium]|nr:DUF512 domain-containing protein [Geobacteraceae bacterium]
SISASGVVTDFLGRLSLKTGIRFSTVAVENSLFGETVTVAGLVPGKAVVEGLRGIGVFDLLLVPDVMLKEDEGIFIDDLTVRDLGEELKTEVAVFNASPSGLYDVLMGRFGR